MPNNDYFMGASGAEMARLLEQDRLYTRVAGGVFPEGEISPNMRVIDIGCGPGGWLLDLGAQYIEVTGVGFDNDKAMVQYAKSRAQALEIAENFTFEVMDIRDMPWPFPSDYFDLVNSRLIGFFPPVLWPKIISEMVRICRPGGIIRLTETEMGVSNFSPGLEQWYTWFFQALFRAGQSFSSNGNRLTITAALAPLLRKAGLREVNIKAHVIDWSAGTPSHREMYENTRAGAKLTEPFFLATGVATREELDANYPRMLQEMEREDFQAVHYLLTAWGQKKPSQDPS